MGIPLGDRWDVEEAAPGKVMQLILGALKAPAAGPSSEGRYLAPCPAHEDERQSMALMDLTVGVLIHCHAGCTTDQILDGLGLTMADLFDKSKD